MKTEQPDEIECRPDGWKRFESAVDAALANRSAHKATPSRPRVTTKKRGKTA
jgi:hypothetical protein